jgi:hypothetical protein
MVTVPANESELAASRQSTRSGEPSERVILPRTLTIMGGLLIVRCAWEAPKLEVETGYIKVVVPVWA